MIPNETAEESYNKRVVERACYLTEAHRSASLTIPSLMPEDQDIRNRNTPVVLDKPFQSLGARGTNTLASKLLLTLFPPTAPFMKFELTGEAKDEADEGGGNISELKALLARRETAIQAEVGLQGIRTKVFQILRHLINSGNVMAYADPAKGGLQVFPLNSYVVQRDGRGTLLSLIYVEKLHRQSVQDPRVLEILESSPSTNPDEQHEDLVLLYTRIERDGARYHSWQEVNGVEVEDSRDTHTETKFPWLVLRNTSIDGEDYGRGYVEEYRGDLTSFEQMSRDMLFASANAAKVVWMIDPTSTINVDKFNETPNGGAISGREGDITAVRLDKGGDMQVVSVQMDRLERSLSADFLLNSSFQRDQERVTAEEIRRMAEDLDDTLGGTYSLLSQELQLPLAHLLEASLVARNEINALPDNTVRIGVVTGLAAIGRGQELNSLIVGIDRLAQVSAVIPGVAEYVKEEEISTRIWTGSGVDTEGLLYTKEEVAANRQQAQQAQAAQTLGQDMSKGAGQIVGNMEMSPEEFQDASRSISQAVPQG